MRDYPSISKSNEPKEPSIWDIANARAASELTGLGEAIRVVAQTRTYDGGQMDLFPKELVKESSLFLAKVEVDKEKEDGTSND